jgi:predicted Na+-dependent transporter
VHFFSLVARWFAPICIGATLAGLFLPWLGQPFGSPWAIRIFLAGILFFSGLKMDFRAAWRELSRPGLVLYASVMTMLVLPLLIYWLARCALPEGLAGGVLITAAMPAGMACAAMADVARGNVALAAVITLVTSCSCPLVAPWLIRLASGRSAARVGGPVWLEAGFLAAILLTPMAAAALVRRLWPRPVARLREACTGLSVLSLALLILGAMSACSDQFLDRLRARPTEVLALFGFMCLFSAVLHLAGYLLAPWRSRQDRTALSINAAYVNNALAIVYV